MRTLTALLLLLAACVDRDIAQVDPDHYGEDETIVDLDDNRNVDILFVIDNSNSMLGEQTSLAQNFHLFMEKLVETEGGLPDVHIGVVSSNVGAGGFDIQNCGGDGDGGRLQANAQSACAPPSGYYIRDVGREDGTRDTNYSGTLSDTFACIAQLGVDGCGLEQHLEAMKRALDGSNPQNAGFLRPDAYLAVVFIADEDDCSAANGQVFDPAATAIDSPLGELGFRCVEYGVTCDGSPTIPREAGRSYENCVPRADSPYLAHPQAYVDFLRSLKSDPKKIIVAGIIGNSTPFTIGTDSFGRLDLQNACPATSTGTADPPVRIRWLLDQFGADRSTFQSICDGDLSAALQQIADLLRVSLEKPCISDIVDMTDLFLDTPGIQPQCQVTDVRFRGTAQEVATPIRRCDMLDAATPDPAWAHPCWWIEADADSCGAGTSGYILRLERDGAPPEGTEVVMRCASR